MVESAKSSGETRYGDEEIPDREEERPVEAHRRRVPMPSPCRNAEPELEADRSGVPLKAERAAKVLPGHELELGEGAVAEREDPVAGVVVQRAFEPERAQVGGSFAGRVDVSDRMGPKLR